MAGISDEKKKKTLNLRLSIHTSHLPQHSHLRTHGIPRSTDQSIELGY